MNEVACIPVYVFKISKKCQMEGWGGLMYAFSMERVRFKECKVFLYTYMYIPIYSYFSKI